MNYEQQKDLLVKKIDQEFYNYKQNLIRNCTPEEIIKQAYEINFREQIRDIITDANLEKKEIKVLLKTDDILEKLYYYWEHSDGNIWEKLEDKVNKKIEEMTENYQKKLMKVR